MTLNKDQMVASVKAEITKWQTTASAAVVPSGPRSTAPRPFNTGPAGALTPPINYATFDDILTKDFNDAVEELKPQIPKLLAGRSGRSAKSGSARMAGHDDVYSFIVDDNRYRDDRGYSESVAVFNYHIKTT